MGSLEKRKRCLHLQGFNLGGRGGPAAANKGHTGRKIDIQETGCNVTCTKQRALHSGGLWRGAKRAKIGAENYKNRGRKLLFWGSRGLQNRPGAGKVGIRCNTRLVQIPLPQGAAGMNDCGSMGRVKCALSWHQQPQRAWRAAQHGRKATAAVTSSISCPR